MGNIFGKQINKQLIITRGSKGAVSICGQEVTEIGVKKNLSKAYVFSIAAARKGHIDSQRKVAEMYEQGSGVKKSVKKAKYWLEKLTKKGDKTAKRDLKRLQKR